MLRRFGVLFGSSSRLAQILEVVLLVLLIPPWWSAKLGTKSDDLPNENHASSVTCHSAKNSASGSSASGVASHPSADADASAVVPTGSATAMPIMK